MNNRRCRNYLAIFCLAILFSGLAACNNNNNNAKQPFDTPTSGSINISVDETFEPLVQAELDVFQATYPNAKIKTQFKPENDAVNDLLKDSVQLIVVPRELSKQEMKTFEALNL